MAKTNVKKRPAKKEAEKGSVINLPPRLVGALADEVAKTVVKRLPGVLPKPRRRKRKPKKIENPVFLDTSAIIDGRIFDLIRLGLFSETFVEPESIILELKHIADSHDKLRRERGRRGLEMLENLRKTRGIKFITIPVEKELPGPNNGQADVDERLIQTAKAYKGKIITCDYNLEKRAALSGVRAVNLNSLANAMKVKAVPGDLLYIKLQHKGKNPAQGVGYLDDGTMIVVEEGSGLVGKSTDVTVTRVIQTSTGRILFARRS